ncbi:MAG: phage tail sheath subtilisin-like domain-containing protein [Bacillota bacterium]|jgi:hypothetical protein
MSLTMPVVEISFRDIAQTAISQRGQVVALILAAAADEIPSANPITIRMSSDIPAVVSDANKTQIRNALIGGVSAPDKVICYFKATTETAYTNAMTALERETWDWLAIPDIGDDDADTIIEWLEDLRDAGQYVKAVLPGVAANKNFIVNFTTAGITVGSATYTAKQYCSRIAGLIAGTPLSQSATYAELPEVSGVTKLSRAERDTAVGNGEFIIFYDGEKVKTGRAVNSATSGADDLKKIKLIEIMDTIRAQVSKKIEDDFIGKYPNTYDNKLVLVSALATYFDSLAYAGIINTGYETGIDVDAQAQYLREHGISVVDMTEQEIREADTGSSVFIYAKIGIPDAIEDVYVAIQR